MTLPFTISSDCKILQSLPIPQVSYTNDAGYWPIWLTATFWKKCWCICWKGMRMVAGRKRPPTLRMRSGREKPQGGHGAGGSWEEKASGIPGVPEKNRRKAQGGCVVREELWLRRKNFPSEAQGCWLSAWSSYRQQGEGVERERKDPLKSLLQNFATTSPSLSTSYRDTVTESIEEHFWLQCR